ncbi:hypothetical protein ABT224_19005 [Streptomyces sp. NPDC001584]|uniref:hypothetical protein n=1 Tax=Streptomyces sp. NPDC001584 TaxID=3154521 RepID=UPI003330C36B
MRGMSPHADRRERPCADFFRRFRWETQTHNSTLAGRSVAAWVPYRDRRVLLENLVSGHALTTPWTLYPMTSDLAMARERLQPWTDVGGVEGTLIK